LRDFLRLSQDPQNLEMPLKDLPLKPVFKVPVTASIFDIFMNMKKLGYHFGVVLDEH
jgi:CBS domain containing-hemolysin-like protein